MGQSKPAFHDDAAGKDGFEVLLWLEKTLLSIEMMDNAEREPVMKYLAGWQITDKFGPQGRSALTGIQKFCIAACLCENPEWETPKLQSLRIGSVPFSDYSIRPR